MRFSFVILSLLSLLFFSDLELFSQDRKTIVATKLTQELVIDGLLDEQFWRQTAVAQDFVQNEPYNGRPATFATHVFIGYDDHALYFAASCEDAYPDSISLELHERDNLGLADYFGIILNPFNDGLNGLGFFVTARGVQMDMKFNTAEDEEDESWDAVWRSATKITAIGWTAEVMIPYSAIRFPRSETQVWGINFQRSIQRLREYSNWNLVDVNRQGFLTQMGEIRIEETITPPMRLSATPYLSASTSHNSATNKWGTGYNYGMDLKVGLNESFTLDLTLIPDFGQVESDELVYSLSPFEVYYDEKRPFFTEGTELFSKGNVFYSRRIGATPSGYFDLTDAYAQEQIIKNPEAVQLINAAKLSGKTSKGLGIGVFNAITTNTFAEVEVEGVRKKIITEPYTNFNMVVAEQALANNSQISFYNTNVLQPDNKRVANVTGVETALRNKQGSTEFYSMLNISQQYDEIGFPVFGERLLMGFNKISGQFRPDVWLNVMTENYDPNDMGFQRSNNEIDAGLNFKFYVFEPKGMFLKKYANLFINQISQYQPLKFSSMEIGGNSRLTTVKHLTIGGNFSIYPLGKLDFFESRTQGKYFQRPWRFHAGIFGSPDYRKKFLVDYRLGMMLYPEWNSFNWWGTLSPRWKISENFLVMPSLMVDISKNDIGFVTDIGVGQQKAIVFGKRNVNNITSSLSLNYSFNPKASLALRLRHYLLYVDYLNYFDLKADAELVPNVYNEKHDFSVNAFNVDMVYRWNFAPGSELLLVWKNAIYTLLSGDDVSGNYFTNLDKLFDSPVGNSLSIKMLYYIDWQQLQTLKRKK